MLSEQEWMRIARALRLSGHELQIIRGVFDDRTESTIADNLGLSPHTVHTHFNRLHRKLAVHTRAGLALRVVASALKNTSSEGVTHNLNELTLRPSAITRR